MFISFVLFGNLSKEELHITPLYSAPTNPVKAEGGNKIQGGGGIFQMRPDLSHMNPQEMDTVEISAEPEFQKLEVTLQSTKQQRIKSNYQKSYSYKMEQEQKESWDRFQYFHPDTSFETSDEIQKLLYEADEGGLEPSTISKKQYLAKIVERAAEKTNIAESYGVCSQALRETLPLDKQVEALMKSVRLMRFSRIKELISISTSDDNLVNILRKFSVLVQGVWIVRSEYCTELRGARYKSNVRDFLLLQLHLNGIVNKKELAMTTNFTNPGELLEIFSSICDKKVVGDRKYWNLKVEEDFSFITSFPVVVDQFKEYWTAEERRLNNFFKISLQSPMKTFLLNAFSTFGVCSEMFLKQSLDKKIKEGEFASLRGYTPAMFAEELGSVGRMIAGNYCLKNHPDEAYDKQRNVVLACFEENFLNSETLTVKKSEIIQKSKEYGVVVPDIQRRKIMEELAYLHNGRWILKSGNGKDGTQ